MEIVFVVASVILFLFLLNYSKKRAIKEREILVPKVALWVGVVSIFSVFVLLYAVIYKDNIIIGFNKNFISFIALMVFFFFGGLYMVLEYFYTYGVFDEKKLIFQSLFNKRKTYNLEEIKSISYNDYLRVLVIQFNNGDKVRLSLDLLGIDEFLTVLENRGF